jgi:hypothetical protein
MAKQKLSINPAYAGKTVWTKPPPYKRDGNAGRFHLDDQLSQKDMAYLLEVMGLTDHIRSRMEPEEPGGGE